MPKGGDRTVHTSVPLGFFGTTQPDLSRPNWTGCLMPQTIACKVESKLNQRFNSQEAL